MATTVQKCKSKCRIKSKECRKKHGSECLLHKHKDLSSGTPKSTENTSFGFIHTFNLNSVTVEDRKVLWHVGYLPNSNVSSRDSESPSFKEIRQSIIEEES